jgi:hypothetical protein
MRDPQCERCQRTMVEIRLKPAGRMVMRSCSYCDVRMWLLDGEPVRFDGVLEIFAERS